MTIVALVYLIVAAMLVVIGGIIWWIVAMLREGDSMKKPYRRPGKLKRILTWCFFMVPAMLMLLLGLLLEALGYNDKDWWIDEHES